jgi:hypothetical protein
METVIFISIIIALLFFWPGYIVRYCHQFLWKRLATKYEWDFYPGTFNWRAAGKDRMTGIYRGRKFGFSYYAHWNSGYGERDYWQTQSQITASLPPDGFFRLDRRSLFRRGGEKINDRYFDKHTRIYREKRIGYTGIVLSDPAIRRRVANYLANPLVEDRKISLTPTGRLKLQDSGIIQTEKRLLKALDLISDIAEVVEDLAREGEVK